MDELASFIYDVATADIPGIGDVKPRVEVTWRGSRVQKISLEVEVPDTDQGVRHLRDAGKNLWN